MLLTDLFDTAVPLRWETDDGREGTGVADVPHDRMVYFYDLRGPVFRIDAPEEARWWVFQRYKSGAIVRTTRLRKGGRYIYIIPSRGAPNVIDCSGSDHWACEPGQCSKVVDAAMGILNDTAGA